MLKIIKIINIEYILWIYQFTLLLLIFQKNDTFFSHIKDLMRVRKN